MKAVSLLSGGLDSTVTLAYALSEGFDVVPLTIRYGQRHVRELESAKAVVKHYGLKQHVIMDLDLSSFRSALTRKDIAVPERGSTAEIGDDIPITYVPARNIIFLSIAAGLAESVDADRIFIGANAIDYSGYPDCRPEFFRAFETVLKVGTKAGVEGNPMIDRAPHPAVDQSGHRPPGREAQGAAGTDLELLPGRGQGVRQMRFLPHPAQGVRGCRHQG